MICDNCNGTGKATAYGGIELLECLCCEGTGEKNSPVPFNESEPEDYQLNPTSYRKERSISHEVSELAIDPIEALEREYERNNPSH